mmetsp:Transcript_25252/g.59410  ORF Transcript_25252/g.59410 Transcript_25252/m.59410 type:complete len:129 (+) Transcript_25252:39-425(+)
MSWQSYVDDHLIASGNVTKASIVGITNADTWATSPGFDLKPEEVKALISGFSDASGLQAGGIFINGDKYMFIKVENGKELIGKKGAAGMCAFKGNTFVMIATHDDSIMPGPCSATVGKLADYLIEQGI